MTQQSMKLYSGPGDDKLPDHVKNLSEEKRRQWVGAWNGRFEQCQQDGESDCEGSAFAVANAAVKELFVAEKAAELGEKYYGKVSQDEAEYSPVGGNNERACSNCRWYIPWDDSCIIVDEYPLSITPNGVSNRWEAIEESRPDPIPVVIVEDSEAGERQASVMHKAIEGLQDTWNKAMALLTRGVTPQPRISVRGQQLGMEQQGFKVIKSASGQYLWFAWASNNYRDREKEIFTDEAHRRALARLDSKEVEPPELWWWHTPGTAWGDTTWWNYTDGFFSYAGTVRDGFETVAEKAAVRDDLGVSHGFRYTYQDEGKGLIGDYYTFEVSPLPLKYAANQYGLSFATILQEAKEMGFSDERRQELAKMFGEDVAKDLESRQEAMAKAMQDSGIESKEVDTDGQDDSQNDEPLIDIKALSDALADNITESEGFKALGSKVEAVSSDIEGIKERLDALEKSDDEKVADILNGKRGRREGYRASQAKETQVDDDDGLAKSEPASPDMIGWIASGAAKQLTGAGSEEI